MSASPKRVAAWILRRSGALALNRRLRERGRAAVLIYHRINDEQDPFFPALSSRVFAEQMEYVSRRYRVQSLEDTFHWLEGGAEGPMRVAVTIDDGYPDTHDIVLPILRRVGIPATVFVATSPPETGRPLALDRLRHLVKHARRPTVSVPEVGLAGVALDGVHSRLTVLKRLIRLLKHMPSGVVDEVISRLERDLEVDEELPSALSWEQVRAMAKGPFTVGGHTHTHYLLSTLDQEQLELEIARSLDYIERELGERPTTFAYPNGQPADYDERAKACLQRLGVRCSVTSKAGFARPGQDPYELPRVNGTSHSLSLFAGRLSGLSRDTL